MSAQLRDSRSELPDEPNPGRAGSTGERLRVADDFSVHDPSGLRRTRPAPESRVCRRWSTTTFAGECLPWHPGQMVIGKVFAVRASWPACSQRAIACKSQNFRWPGPRAVELADGNGEIAVRVGARPWGPAAARCHHGGQGMEFAKAEAPGTDPRGLCSDASPRCAIYLEGGPVRPTKMTR